MTGLEAHMGSLTVTGVENSFSGLINLAGAGALRAKKVFDEKICKIVSDDYWTATTIELHGLADQEFAYLMESDCQYDKTMAFLVAECISPTAISSIAKHIEPNLPLGVTNKLGRTDSVWIILKKKLLCYIFADIYNRETSSSIEAIYNRNRSMLSLRWSWYADGTKRRKRKFEPKITKDLSDAQCATVIDILCDRRASIISGKGWSTEIWIEKGQIYLSIFETGVGTYAIYVMNIDGSGIRALMEQDKDPLPPHTPINDKAKVDSVLQGLPRFAQYVKQVFHMYEAQSELEVSSIVEQLDVIRCIVQGKVCECDKKLLKAAAGVIKFTLDEIRAELPRNSRLAYSFRERQQEQGDNSSQVFTFNAVRKLQRIADGQFRLRNIDLEQFLEDVNAEKFIEDFKKIASNYGVDSNMPKHLIDVRHRLLQAYYDACSARVIDISNNIEQKIRSIIELMLGIGENQEKLRLKKDCTRIYTASGLMLVTNPKSKYVRVFNSKDPPLRDDEKCLLTETIGLFGRAMVAYLLGRGGSMNIEPNMKVIAGGVLNGHVELHQEALWQLHVTAPKHVVFSKMVFMAPRHPELASEAALLLNEKCLYRCSGDFCNFANLITTSKGKRTVEYDTPLPLSKKCSILDGEDEFIIRLARTDARARKTEPGKPYCVVELPTHCSVRYDRKVVREGGFLG